MRRTLVLILPFCSHITPVGVTVTGIAAMVIVGIGIIVGIIVDIIAGIAVMVVIAGMDLRPHRMAGIEGN
ncbi:MAG: hypothetical protein ACYDGO_04225 [Smithellaceae bacterium]